MKKIIAVLLCVCMLAFVFAGCSNKSENTETKELSTAKTESDETTKKSSSSKSDHTQVKVTMKDGGEFVIELYPEYAPETVENFINLVNDGFYNGLKFHRVMGNFMAQTGDPTGTGNGGSDKTIKGEFSANGVENNLSHTRGVVSMARRSNDYDSGSSQFFICYSDMYASALDGQYAAFGKVVEGMDVVDSFAEVEMERNDSGELASPKTPIVIEKWR